MHHRPIKSFVLRAGRLSKRQSRGLDNLSQYSLPHSSTCWDFSNIFERHAPTIVEIGFGMGDSLWQMAQENPDKNFIGIEVHQAGVGALVSHLMDHEISNVRIFNDDAMKAFQHLIPQQSLAGIQLFFPDPWPKKRHHKRRIVQPKTIDIWAHCLKENGFIHCATDWEAYAYHMLEVFSQTPTLINKNPSGTFYDKETLRPKTKFENRGLKLGHGVWDLIFLKS